MEVIQSIYNEIHKIWSSKPVPEYVSLNEKDRECRDFVNGFKGVKFDEVDMNGPYLSEENTFAYFTEESLNYYISCYLLFCLNVVISSKECWDLSPAWFVLFVNTYRGNELSEDTEKYVKITYDVIMDNAALFLTLDDVKMLRCNRY
jgi:hypothetical protein